MKKPRTWKIIFAICCLVYMGWVINVGSTEFDRINSQYGMLVDQLDKSRIKAAAHEELTVECSRELKRLADRDGGTCNDLPDFLLEARAKLIEERRVQARERGIIKMVLFYTGFVLIFLFAPPFLTYLLIAGILKLKETIKIVR